MNGSSNGSINDIFRRFSAFASNVVGSPWAFLVALLVIVLWAVSGPVFGFSDTWQLVINTGTTIVTFLMVFLIQNTQNRDARAIHLKLDELLRTMKGARTSMVDLEDLSDEELARLQEEFKRFREQHNALTSSFEETVESIDEALDDTVDARDLQQEETGRDEHEA
ncbi:MAG: low affinity iron permease family protein [Chloroflexi bacterium]|jgi:low affinity Fe/Cu permease|nr:low affinity iron permease family protein [Chloroflexota bacterium]